MAENTGQKLALFDLDGTLTRKDTLFEIIQYIHNKRHFYTGLFRLSPFLFLLKIKLMPNWKVKEKVLTYFFGGMPYDFFRQKCDQFASERLPQLLRKDAVKVLDGLKNEGASIVIVSASAENWIAAWCDQQKISYIATRLEVEKGRLTGKIAGKNCYGIEKVNRIKQTIDLSGYEAICAYGDSKGDRPMLRLATHAYYKIFHQ